MGGLRRLVTISFPDSYTGPGAKHQAFLYASEDDFLSTTAPFLAAGLEAGESIVAITSGEKLDALRATFGELPPSAFLVDSDDWYRKPSEAVARWTDFVHGQATNGRTVRAVAEIVSVADSQQSVDEWMDYESIVNSVLAPLPLWVICLYDVGVLPDSIIEQVRASHPATVEDGLVRKSAAFLPPADRPARSLALNGLRPLTRQHIDVASACAHVEVEARRAGLRESPIQRLLAATTEVASNAFGHGRPPVFVTAWNDGERFVCQIEDQGPGISDPAAGFAPPAAGRGWGLWLARQSADSLAVGRSDRGSAVRLAVSRNRAETLGGPQTRL